MTVQRKARLAASYLGMGVVKITSRGHQMFDSRLYATPEAAREVPHRSLPPPDGRRECGVSAQTGECSLARLLLRCW